VSLIFLVVAFAFSFFPATPLLDSPVWAAEFNWSSVIFAATCLLALGYYLVGGGREKYIAPVSLVKED
jgi:hypothetical protein